MEARSAAHTTHAAAVAVVGRRGVLLRHLGDHGFGGQSFSSIPSESMRPTWVFPVEYSVARKRMPSSASRLA
jgi:hypothetical protein